MPFPENTQQNDKSSQKLLMYFQRNKAQLAVGRTTEGREGEGGEGRGGRGQKVAAPTSVWPPERVTMSLSDRPICLINTSLKWSLPATQNEIAIEQQIHYFFPFC